MKCKRKSKETREVMCVHKIIYIYIYIINLSKQIILKCAITD